MTKWTNTAVFHEINRQSGWRLSKIEMLEGDRDWAAFKNARLLKRRASYQAKNNGKGRPPKALLEFSREQGFRLDRFKFEAQLLEELLAELPAAPDALEMLKRRAGLERSKPADNVQALRLAKLEGLIGQFSRVVPPLSSLPSHLPWDGKIARQYFAILLQRQRARCRVFDRVVLLREVERVEEERERARFEFLHRANFSNHLASVNTFVSAMQVWRADIPSAKPRNTVAWSAAWRQTADEIWRDTAEIFDLGPVSPW